MTKPKTLEQLRAEKERAETQLAQDQKGRQIVHDWDCVRTQMKYSLIFWS